jgi:hypothetical protein
MRSSRSRTIGIEPRTPFTPSVTKLVTRSDTGEPHTGNTSRPRPDDGRKFTHDIAEVDAKFFDYVRGM